MEGIGYLSFVKCVLEQKDVVLIVLDKKNQSSVHL